MRWTIAGKAVLLFIAFAVLPLLVQALHSIAGRWSDTHDQVAAELERRVVAVSGAVDERLASVTAEFDGYVSMGFARLSAESVAARPGLGLVEARLRAPSSVSPLSTPFDAFSIYSEWGESLWQASDPIDQDGALIYTNIVTGAGTVDTLGVAAALAAAGKVVVLRRSDGAGETTLRWARSIRPDPHDRQFVVCAELSLRRLLAGLAGRVAGVATEAADGRLAVAVPLPGAWSPVPPAAGRADLIGGPARWWSDWRDRLRQQSLTARLIEPHLGVTVEGEIALQPFYQPMMGWARWTLLGAGLAILVGFTVLLAWLRSLRNAVDAVIAGADRFAAGETERRIDVQTGDEIEAIAASVNRMADAYDEALSSRNRQST